MTDERDAPGGRDDLVDRQALARAVNDRMRERRVKQKDLARAADVSVATLRKIQRAQGTNEYGNGVLSRISVNLGWAEDYLIGIAYGWPERDSISPSQAELVTQEMMAQLAPYLTKIDAMEKRLSVVMDAIHHVSTRIEAVLDVHSGPARDR